MNVLSLNPIATSCGAFSAPLEARPHLPMSDLWPRCGPPRCPPMPRILLLEDDLDTQGNLRDILELDGYCVDAAAALQEAVRTADWASYQAIIMDRSLVDGLAEDLLSVPQLV